MQGSLLAEADDKHHVHVDAEPKQGGTTATCHVAPETIGKYFNVCFFSPGMGGSDWKGGWTDPL